MAAKTNHHKTWKFVGLGLLAVIVILSGWLLFEFIDVILMSIAAAYIVFPVAKKMNNGNTSKDMKWLSASFAGVLLVILPFIFLILYSMNIALQWFIQNLGAVHSGQFIFELKTGLDSMGLGIISERISSEIGKLASGVTGTIGAAVLKPTFLIGFFIKIALFFVATFYFVYEGPHFRKILKKYVPAREKFLNELISSVDRIFYGLFVGHIFTSVIIAITAAVGFWLILQPSLITLSLLTFLMFVISFLPVIGPWLMYVPMALWQIAFIDGGLTNGIALLVFGFIFLTLIPDFYIRPKLVQRGAEIHPLLLILGFFAGPLIFGAKGIIIGPLILGLAQAMVTLYAEKRHILKDLIEHF